MKTMLMVFFLGTTFLGISADSEFEGSWFAKIGDNQIRMKIRVDQNDIIGYLYNEKGVEYLITGVITDNSSFVTIRDSNHFSVCDGTIDLNNGHLDFKAKGSPKTKETGIPKTLSFTKEY